MGNARDISPRAARFSFQRICFCSAVNSSDRHQAKRPADFHLRRRRRSRVAEQPNRGSHRAVDREMVTPRCRTSPSDVMCWTSPAERFFRRGYRPSTCASNPNPAQNLLIRPVTQRPDAQRFFRRRIRGSNRAGGADQQQTRRILRVTSSVRRSDSWAVPAPECKRASSFLAREVFRSRLH